MADFAAYSAKKKVTGQSLVIGLLGTGFLVVYIVVSQLVHLSGFAKTLSDIYFYISILSCIGGLGGYYVVDKWSRQSAYWKFIADNGWDSSVETDLANVATSLIKAEGQPPSTGYGFSGSYKGHDMHGVKYIYATTDDRQQAVLHSFINLSFDLHHIFPLMVLDDKRNDFLFASNLPERVAGGIALQLEGNFSKRFRLTVLPGTQRDVLQLLTPDFMHELYDSVAAADIEIQANKLFIIARADEFDEKTLRNLFGMADLVLKNLAEVSDTWQASSSADTIVDMAATSLGPRLGLVKNARPKAIGIGGILIGAAAYFALLVISGTQ